MTVYLIEVGEYSDRDIISVFSNKDAAEAFARINDGNVLEFPVDESTIEELNTEIQEMIDKEELGYRFEFTLNGKLCDEEESRKIVNISSEDLIPKFKLYENNVIISVCTKNIDSEEEYKRCLKVAQDKRAKFLSEQFNL